MCAGAALLWAIALLPTLRLTLPEPRARWIATELPALPPVAPRIESSRAPAPVVKVGAGSQLQEAEPAAAVSRAEESQASDVREWFVEDLGPVAERRSRFETEPRDSAAHAIEAELRAAFSAPGVDPELFRSVLCRLHVCKVQIQWTSFKLQSYVSAISSIMVAHPQEIAAAPTDLAGANDSRIVEVFLERATPAE